MSDTQASKVDALDAVLENLEALITKGRSELAEMLEAQKAEENRQLEEAYYDITTDIIDMSDPDADKILDLAKRKNASEAKRKSVEDGLKNWFSKLNEGITNIFHRAGSLDVLMDAISMLPGELFGGRMQELVTERIDKSSIRFKARRLLYNEVLTNKLEEIYGKDFYEKCKSYVIKNNLNNNVFFLGKLTPENLRHYYLSSQYYLQLSVYEGFGVSLCEAMLCECIPIGSSVNIIPEIIGDSGFILEKESIDELVFLVKTVMKIENKRKQ
jgi:hypothetical protein